MNRLINTINPTLTIRDTTQTSTRQQSQRTRNNTSLITDDITEQVTRDNNAVQLTGVLNHNHSRRINKLVLNLQLWELLRHDLGDGLPPQPTRSQHVGLIQTPHGERGVVLQSKVGREARDPLDLGARVRLRVHGVAAAVIFLAVTEVDSARQFADDVEVDALADGGFQGGVFDQGGGREVAGTQVAECAHLFAKLEETLLRADGAGAPFLLVGLVVVGGDEDGGGG